MKRSPTKSKRLVRVMKDPMPLFVSLVPQGANQRSFHATKAAQKEAPMPGQKTPKTKTTKNTTGDAKIHLINFAAEDFADEAAVEAFLVEKGYSDFTVTKTDKGFSVVDTPEDQIEGDLREVQHSTVKGVSYLVGTAKPAAAVVADAKTEDKPGEPGAEDAPVIVAGTITAEEITAASTAHITLESKAAVVTELEAAPLAVKARKRSRNSSVLQPGGLTLTRLAADWETFAETAEASDKKSLADTILDYTGGMPPGMWAVFDAYMTELRRMFQAGDVTDVTIASLNAELTLAISAMHGAFLALQAQATVKAADGTDATKPDTKGQDALLASIFAMPVVKGTDPLEGLAGVLDVALTNALAGLMGNITSIKAVTNDTYAAVLLATANGSATEDEDDAPAPLLGRKSDTGEEPELEVVDPATQAENEETLRRVAKRLGA